VKIGIDEQVEALEDAVNNHRSYVNIVKRYVEKKERPEELLKDTETRLPKMEAALNTLKWVQKNREIIIEAKKALDK
jgi:predicted outer membrane protein